MKYKKILNGHSYTEWKEFSKKLCILNNKLKTTKRQQQIIAQIENLQF